MEKPKFVCPHCGAENPEIMRTDEADHLSTFRWFTFIKQKGEYEEFSAEVEEQKDVVTYQCNACENYLNPPIVPTEVKP